MYLALQLLSESSKKRLFWNSDGTKLLCWPITSAFLAVYILLLLIWKVIIFVKEALIHNNDGTKQSERVDLNYRMLEEIPFYSFETEYNYQDTRE